jgi:hypothetical protein
MSDEVINEEQSPEDISPPVFDNGDGIERNNDDDDDEFPSESSDVSESFRPTDPPKVRRGRKPKKGGVSMYGEGRVRKPILPWEDRNLEYDNWCDAFYWGKDAALKFQIKRLSPERSPNGQSISGILETRQGVPMYAEEVRAVYGGGTFEATVSGMHPYDKENKSRLLARRRLPLPGPPNLNDAAMPRHFLSSRGGAVVDNGMGIGVVRRELESLRNNSEGSPRIVERTLTLMKDVADQRAGFAERSSEERINLIRQQLEEEKKEKVNLSARLRETESEMAKKAAQNQQELSKSVKEAQDSSMTLLTTLLPTLTGNASEQVKQIASLHQIREERQAAEHKMVLQQMQANFQTQLDSNKALHMAQMESQKSQYENTIALLRSELQIARAEVTSLRTTLDAKTQELITRSTEQNKTKSPIEQMTEMGTMFEAMNSMKDYFGGGGDENKSPMDRVLGIFEGAAQNAPAFLQALRQNQQPQQPVQVPPQLSMPQSPQRLIPPQHSQTLVPPQRTAPIKKSGIQKSDMKKVLDYIEGVLSSGGDSPPSPETVAMSAVSQVDNNILKFLSSRDPERVIAQLGNNDMLSGILLEEKGRKYLVDVLIALKKKFSS